MPVANNERTEEQYYQEYYKSRILLSTYAGTKLSESAKVNAVLSI